MYIICCYLESINTSAFFLSFHFPFLPFFLKVRLVYSYNYTRYMRTSVLCICIYRFASNRMHIHIDSSDPATCFILISFFGFSRVYPRFTIVHAYTVLEYVLLHFLGIMKFHEIHCEKYSERRDEWEMLIADHLPRALDTLSAFTIHNSRLYLCLSTYHPGQIRNLASHGNNTRRAATWECIHFSIFRPNKFFRFLLSLSLFFLFRWYTSNLRSQRRAPSLSKLGEHPSLSWKI